MIKNTIIKFKNNVQHEQVHADDEEISENDCIQFWNKYFYVFYAIVYLGIKKKIIAKIYKKYNIEKLPRIQKNQTSN